MSQTTRILLALAAGLVVGIALAALAPDWAPGVLTVAQPIGTAWLNGLQMTIVPLVVALIVTGVAASAEAARAGRLTARAIATFIVLLWCVSALAALLTPLFLDIVPIPTGAATGMRAALAHAQPVGEIAPFSQFITTLVPTNAVTAAANDAFLPLIVFALVFAFGLAIAVFAYGIAVGKPRLFPHDVIEAATEAARDWRDNWRHYLGIRSK